MQTTRPTQGADDAPHIQAWAKELAASGFDPARYEGPNLWHRCTNAAEAVRLASMTRDKRFDGVWLRTGPMVREATAVEPTIDISLTALDVGFDIRAAHMAAKMPTVGYLCVLCHPKGTTTRVITLRGPADKVRASLVREGYILAEVA